MYIDFVGKNFTLGNFPIEYNGTDYNIGYASIPTGALLYHGDNLNTGNDILVGDLKYFLIEPEHEVDNQYGIMHRFRTKIPLNFIRLDNKDTQKYLYEISNDRNKLILEQNFGYNNSSKRKSDPDTDAEIAKFICELCKDSDFHGYLTDVMNTDMEGKFHPEIVICNPLDKLNFVETITPEKMWGKLLDDGKISALKRKEHRENMQDNDNSPINSTIFNDSMFSDTPVNSPTKNGGKKSKKKKKGNKRKTSKNKRKRIKK